MPLMAIQVIIPTEKLTLEIKYIFLRVSWVTPYIIKL